MDYSTTAPPAVSQRLCLELVSDGGPTLPFEGELRYNATDPYAVTAIFHTGRGPVPWTFGRDLLATGLHEPAGDGDVHVWPCLDADGHAVVLVELCSPDGDALVQMRSGDVTTFVQRMHQAVPAGAESSHLELDATIAALLDTCS